MTKFSEFPLRPHGAPWPGLKDSRSRLMTQGGEMSDCTNVIINTEDVLEKRKGLVRAFDEWFIFPICGLFKYTDEFGRERILIAHDAGFAIRTPFALPVFTQSDAYPFDSFEDLSPGLPYSINSLLWRNRDRYEGFDDRMRLRTVATASRDVNNYAGYTMRWFKEQTSRSYQVRIQYEFDSSGQDLFINIKGSDDFSGAGWMAVLSYEAAGTASLKLYWRDSVGTLTLMGEESVGGVAGFLTLSYDQAERRATATLVPSGSAITKIVSDQLTVIQDLDLGQNCGIGIARDPSSSASGEILVVDGGLL